MYRCGIGTGDGVRLRARLAAMYGMWAGLIGVVWTHALGRTHLWILLLLLIRKLLGHSHGHWTLRHPHHSHSLLRVLLHHYHTLLYSWSSRMLLHHSQLHRLALGPLHAHTRWTLLLLQHHHSGSVRGHDAVVSLLGHHLPRLHRALTLHHHLALLWVRLSSGRQVHLGASGDLVL